MAGHATTGGHAPLQPPDQPPPDAATGFGLLVLLLAALFSTWCCVGALLKRSRSLTAGAPNAPAPAPRLSRAALRQRALDDALDDELRLSSVLEQRLEQTADVVAALGDAKTELAASLASASGADGEERPKEE